MHPEERGQGEMGSPEKITERIEGRERGRDPIGLDPIHRSKSHPDRRPGWRNSGVHAKTMNTSILMHASLESTTHDQHHPKTQRKERQTEGSIPQQYQWCTHGEKDGVCIHPKG